MHQIEPFFNWREVYISSEDSLSPFFEREYNEMTFTQKIYNYYIHPQWDFFGSSTLYIKILFADYNTGYAVIEMIGEWNDAINNDIMFLKTDVIEQLIGNGIDKFILIGENVLNFHASDECYYEEWYEDIKETDGWIIALNFQDHIIDEFRENNIHHYVHMGERYNNIEWRKLKPDILCNTIDDLLLNMLA